MGHSRRRSVDSSSSSSSDEGKESRKWGSEKKNPGGEGFGFPQPSPTFPAPSSGHMQTTAPGFGEFSQTHDVKQPPPAYSEHHTIPPSGYRLPLTTGGAFPGVQQTGNPPFFDADGKSPVFLGSAIFPNAVHPCKINPNLQPPCRVPYGGGEHEHNDRFDLLPFTPDTMEFVRASHGRIPPGRRPVEGGYEDHGAKLYHGVAEVQGVRVPGKAAEHLGGCNVAFGGGEHIIRENYDLLCWK